MSGFLFNPISLWMLALLEFEIGSDFCLASFCAIWERASIFHCLLHKTTDNDFPKYAPIFCRSLFLFQICSSTCIVLNWGPLLAHGVDERVKLGHWSKNVQWFRFHFFYRGSTCHLPTAVPRQPPCTIKFGFWRRMTMRIHVWKFATGLKRPMVSSSFTRRKGGSSVTLAPHSAMTSTPQQPNKLDTLELAKLLDESWLFSFNFRNNFKLRRSKHFRLLQLYQLW